MDFKIKIKPLEGKEDKYFLKISTYKDSIEGTFDQSEIRSMIGELDNAIL